MIAVDCAVYSFVATVFFVAGLALIEPLKVSFREGLLLTVAFVAIVHGVGFAWFARSQKRAEVAGLVDGPAVKLLEYTVSTVIWGLHFLLWWYGAMEASCVFLFVPTCFVTSLLVYHGGFGWLAGKPVGRMKVLVVALNLWTLCYDLLIFLKVIKF